MTSSEKIKAKATSRDMLYAASGFLWGVITTVVGLFVFSQILAVFN